MLRSYVIEFVQPSYLYIITLGNLCGSTLSIYVINYVTFQHVRGYRIYFSHYKRHVRAADMLRIVYFAYIFTHYIDRTKFSHLTCVTAI